MVKLQLRHEGGGQGANGRVPMAVFDDACCRSHLHRRGVAQQGEEGGLQAHVEGVEGKENVPAEDAEAEVRA